MKLKYKLLVFVCLILVGTILYNKVNYPYYDRALVISFKENKVHFDEILKEISILSTKEEKIYKSGDELWYDNGYEALYWGHHDTIQGNLIDKELMKKVNLLETKRNPYYLMALDTYIGMDFTVFRYKRWGDNESGTFEFVYTKDKSLIHDYYFERKPQCEDDFKVMDLDSNWYFYYSRSTYGG